MSGGGPVIPNFGGASECVTNNDLFCTDWVQGNWCSVLQPALARPRQADPDRGRHRLRDRLRGRGFRTAVPLRRAPVQPVQRAPLHDPEHRALPGARALHGTDRDDGRDRARRLHAADPLPQHAGRVPRRAGGRARGGRGWGCAAADPVARSRCRSRCLRSWPAYASPSSRWSAWRRWPRSSSPRGSAIRSSRRCQTSFKTEFIAAGALAVALALVVDAPARWPSAC